MYNKNMKIKKQTLSDFNKRLKKLREASKVPFNSKLEAIRVSYDLSVIKKNKKGE